MTQIIFGGIYLPQARWDKYWCHETILGEELPMISGRIVTELRGVVYEAHYEYDYLPEDIWRSICGDLRRKTPVVCSLLPDDSDELVVATMKCTELITPTFIFGLNGKALWHNVAFTLREERPHA